ncbi:TPA: hypothetical protein RQJ89_000635 [Vibrio vulnificus]|nr:hypothetical protein [Vibrio vulnificus]HDY7663505.1 hypothetical protein [Vibrio vulnificus]HDY7667345.1 hypothetical protein [Vibrio vulnificus]HDY8043787.1 hypothetical protein [Vibrio vulnificus]
MLLPNPSRVKPTAIAFVDATKLQVCHNLRIPRHRYLNVSPNVEGAQWARFMDLNSNPSLMTKEASFP